MKKSKLIDLPFKLFSNGIFIVMSILCIIPFLLLISISFSNENDIIDGGYSLIPQHFSLEAYKFVFADFSSLFHAYGVTLFYAVVGTIFSVVLMAALGYVLSRDIFIFKKSVIVYLIITMIFSGGLIPSYIINATYLHLENNVLIYILSGAVSAYTIFVFKAFFQQIPKALMESAYLDGASELVILSRITVPLSKPVLATFAFTGFISRWNNFEVSLYYITDKKLFTLQLMLQNILNEAKFLKQMTQQMSIVMENTNPPVETLKFAMCILAAGPMILIFPLFQKHFVKGMVVGAVKG